MNSKKRPELERSEVIESLPLACADELAAVEFFEQQRWGGTPTCPHCSSSDVCKLNGRDGKRNKRFLWLCRGCEQQYTVRIGSVFEDSRLPLKHWAYGFWRACASKKGVSAREIERHCQISYKSALFLMHRIRFALTDTDPNRPKLDGECEVDETFVGGKPRPGDGNKTKTGYRKDSNKIPVVAMVKRGGEVRTRVVPSVTVKNVGQFVDANVAKTATGYTDQSVVYHAVFYRYARHEVVNHKRKEYARLNPDGTVAGINHAESFFSLLKRGLNGIFHAVSKEHLHRYCHEFAFRWNTRKLNDGERISRAIKGAFGKRLVYSAAQ